MEQDLDHLLQNGQQACGKGLELNKFESNRFRTGRTRLGPAAHTAQGTAAHQLANLQQPGTSLSTGDAFRTEKYRQNYPTRSGTLHHYTAAPPSNPPLWCTPMPRRSMGRMPPIWGSLRSSSAAKARAGTEGFSSSRRVLVHWMARRRSGAACGPPLHTVCLAQTDTKRPCAGKHTHC